jgi:sugar lactone lactonase YvrE
MSRSDAGAGVRHKQRWHLALAALCALLVIVGAASSSASAEDSEPAIPSTLLTPQLIEEAISSPNAMPLEAPPTDIQAAQQLPHDELGRTEALHLLSSVFGAEIENPGGLLDEMPPAKFLSDHAAVMQAGTLAAAMSGGEELSGEKALEPTLVESSVPLKAEDAEGRQAPVDLSLEHSDGELQPANPIVDTGIPTELGEGISLAGGDVELAFPEASEERAPSTVEGDAAFYPNVQEDSDLLVAPVPGGVETMTQIRTAQAPRTQIIHVTLPEGAHLEEDRQGGVQATVNGRRLLAVAPPSAVDAAGNAVPMTVAVSGDNVELTISPSEDSAYPILADPVWTLEEYNWTWGGSSFSGWTPESFVPSYHALTYQYPNAFPAIDVTSGFPGGATPNTGAGWKFLVPRYASDMAKYGVPPDSFISAVFTQGMMFLLEGNHAYYPVLIAGIIDAEKGEWTTYTTWNGTQGEIGGWSGHANFFNFYEPEPLVGAPHYNEDTHAREFVFDLVTLENEAQAKYRNVVAAQATTEVADHNTPEVNLLSGPAGWVNTGEAVLSYSASDAGLGVTDLEVVPPGGHLNGFGQGSSPEFPVGCTGVAANPCPREVSSKIPGSPKITINAATAPEGMDKYTFAAFDPLYSSGFSEGPVSHIAQEPFTLQVDHTAPTLALSGSLIEQASLGSAKPQYALKYNAADGTETPPTVLTSYGTEGTGNGQFKHPADVSRAADGSLWIADENNNRIEKLNEKGEFLAAYGTLGSGNGQLSHPTGIELDSSGNPWVSDSGNNRIEELNSKGEYVRKFGTAGSGNGQLSAPQGIALAANGNVWVSDTANNRIEEFSSTGSFLGAFGSNGSGNGQFKEPSSLDIGPGGNVWVADAGNNRIEELNEKGEFVAVYGTLGSGNGQLSHPDAIEVDTGGSVWVADQNNGRVEQFSERGEYLGQFGSKGTGAGQFTFSNPTGLTTNGAGSLWVVDSGGSRIERWNAPQGTRSGVRNVVVKMDGKVVQQPNVKCPEGGCPLTGEWTLHSGEYSAGAHTVEVTATDGVGLPKTESLNITLNPPAPSLALSGTMTEQASLGTKRPQYILKLNAAAEEGTGIAQPGRSTVATEITIDGKRVDSGEASCSTESCPITREWTLKSGEFSAGSHTVVAKATDRYGYWTSKTRTFEIQPDVTKPTLQVGGELANAPEGWVEQESYKLNATAADPTGYGVTSLVFRIGGSTVASTTKPCPEGGCEASISKEISMAPYSGGTHEAEVVATDGAGNTTTKPWTINVDPEGHVTTAEAMATMEAVEETSESNLIGNSAEEDIGGTAPGLGLESTETGFAATGSAAPMTVGADPGDAMTVEVPEAAEIFGCRAEAEEQPSPEEESDEPCIPATEAGDGKLQRVVVTPLGVGGTAGPQHLVEENAAVSANTASATDTVVRPLNDGGMIFQAIRDNAAPETYSYRVTLGERQELTQVDATHVQVYYSNGFPAFAITAIPSSDAVGTSVPTTLQITGDDVIALTVHYKDGANGSPFVFPVVSGTGWEGGFRTETVSLEGLNPSGEEYWESGNLIVGPPEPLADAGEASASSNGDGAARKQFVRVICGHSSFYGRTAGEGYTQECGNPFMKKQGYSTPWQAGMRGAFFYKPGGWAEERGARACAGYGYDVSLSWYYYVKNASQCTYGPRTSDENGGTKTTAGHYLRAQAHWEVGHAAKCSEEFGEHQSLCPPPNPVIWEDKAIELHLWPSGIVEWAVP